MQRAKAGWLAALRAYILISIGAHLAWEIFQLPLYTIWFAEEPRQIAFAILHCTVGDGFIAILALSLALISVGHEEWPADSYWRVMIVTVALGVGYTIFSEWRNVAVQGTWAYSPSMPIVPVLGTGLLPLLQWIVVPESALTGARFLTERGAGH